MTGGLRIAHHRIAPKRAILRLKEGDLSSGSFDLQNKIQSEIKAKWMMVFLAFEDGSKKDGFIAALSIIASQVFLLRFCISGFADAHYCISGAFGAKQ